MIALIIWNDFRKEINDVLNKANDKSMDKNTKDAHCLR